MKLAVANRLPVVYGFGGFVEVGGLISYGASFRELYRRVAVFVDKILKGATSDLLPVEQPTKFELVMNNRTAKALGLTIPQYAAAAGGPDHRVARARPRGQLLRAEARLRAAQQRLSEQQKYGRGERI